MSNESNFRILIIDDNKEIHTDFIKILNTYHETKTNVSLGKIFPDKQKFKNPTTELNIPIFEIDTALQGYEGVEKLKLALEEGRPYSLAFVDIRMPPGWDGIETIKRIWKLDRDIQVVICTAYSDYSWEETIEELGAGANLLILKKPFDNVAVRQLAFSLTKKWKLLQDQQNYTNLLENKVKERTISLQKSLSEMQATLESSTDGIVVVSNLGKITNYNNRFITMWEIPAEIVVNRLFEPVIKHMTKKIGEPNKLLSDIKNLNDKPSQTREQSINLLDGRFFEYYTQPHKLDNEISGRVWSFRDITQQIYLEKKLEYQATHDSLTGLPNRLLLMQQIKNAIAISNRNKSSFAIIFFDLDRFKTINDSLSHAVGDELLKVIATRIKSMIRSSDMLARLGGDEFVLIMQNIHKHKEELIIETVNRLLSVISKPFNIASHMISITSSIGISVYSKDGTTPDELLRNADLAMYLAKREGRNKFQFYSKDLNEKSLLRFEKEIELRKAIENKEFLLHYQPQINSSNNELIGVEALLRWQHPEHGIIPPIEFIEVAEETGLITQIGSWVLHTACQQNKTWQSLGMQKFIMSINISSFQINDPNFFNILTTALEQSELEPQYLQLELTENVIFNNNFVLEVLKKISDLGVLLSFDDFGTGNSSLSYLRKAPIDQLKIDRSFVKNINNNDANDEVIIRAILSMAKELNLDVVAEGVEHKKQLDFLNSYNCNNIQGYYFSKPLTAEELESYLSNL